jgi:hypothetical protein
MWAFATGAGISGGLAVIHQDRPEFFWLCIGMESAVVLLWMMKNDLEKQ